MNPWVAAVTTAFSMKRELKFIAGTFLILCLLPVFAVTMATQVGINLISEVLASGDPQTGIVEIHDPGTGDVVGTITAPRFWPVSGPVSLEFGAIDLPYQPLHTGIDIASYEHKVGDPVVAFMAGDVTYADSVSWGYGKHIYIDHGGHVTSVYAHLDTLAVTVGQHVEAGTVLGLRGSTGWSTGPHLHFETRVFGIPVNPRTFLSGNP